jgi:hypothetical protein
MFLEKTQKHRKKKQIKVDKWDYIKLKVSTPQKK